jgi:zinc transport system permease protein
MAERAKMDTFLNMFLDPFQFEFMRTSLEVSFILSLLCGGLGVLLIPRGLSMVGDGLAHATFGGIGIGLLAGGTLTDSIWYALPFVLVVSVLIVFLGKHSRLSADAALGVFFAVSLAIGITALHVATKRGSGVDIEAVLFGNILAIQPGEVLEIRVFGLLIGSILIYLGPRIAYAGFYGELATLSKIRVQLKEYILMVLTAIVTVLTVKAVGVMLVSAWLVIPATIGKNLSKSMGFMLLWTILNSIVGSIVGILLSFHYDIPTGAAMTLAVGVLFALSLVLKEFATIFRSRC